MRRVLRVWTPDMGGAVEGPGILRVARWVGGRQFPYTLYTPWKKNMEVERRSLEDPFSLQTGGFHIHVHDSKSNYFSPLSLCHDLPKAKNKGVLSIMFAAHQWCLAVKWVGRSDVPPLRRVCSGKLFLMCIEVTVTKKNLWLRLAKYIYEGYIYIYMDPQIDAKNILETVPLSLRPPSDQTGLKSLKN